MSVPFPPTNDIEVIVPVPALALVILYASGTLPEFVIVNVRATAVPVGKLSVPAFAAVSFGETEIAETDATVSARVFDCDA